MQAARTFRFVALTMFVTLTASAGERAIVFDFSPSPMERIQAKLSAERLQVTVPRAASTPRLNGRLNEGVWRSAPAIRFAPKRDRASRTTVKLLFDDKALYLGATCSLGGRAKPVAVKRDRDDNPWRDDCLEIWIAPGGGAGQRYQFILNAVGSVMDLRGPNRGYDPSWGHVVRRGKGLWTAEIAIPKEALGLEAWPPTIALNIARNVPPFGRGVWTGSAGDTSRSEIVLQGVTQRQARAAAAGGGLDVSFPRSRARAGERWIEGAIAVGPSQQRGARLKAELYALGSNRPAASAEAVPTRPRGRVAVNLRAAGLTRGRLVLSRLDGGRRTVVSERFLEREADAPLKAGTRIPVHLHPPAGLAPPAGWPVTFGVPFAAGQLWDAGQLRLVDDRGQEIPSQSEVMATWYPDGSIKWVRFDALVSKAVGCQVEVAKPTGAARPPTPVTVSERGDVIVVETAGTRYVLGKGASPIREIHHNGRRVATSRGARGLFVVDQKGQMASAVANGESVRVESRGPVEACVRFEGWYATSAGKRLARHITRVRVLAGQPEARVVHTLILTEDTNKTWFRDIGWELAVEPGADPKAVFAASRDDWGKTVTEPLTGATSALMLQDSHFYFLKGKNHFSIQRLASGGRSKTVREGPECGDWAMLIGDNGGLAFNCEDAARQHPKEFEVRRDRLILHLFSNRAGEELDFRPLTLIKKWDVPRLFKKLRLSSDANLRGDPLEAVKQAPSNAQGFAKTHKLVIAPLTGDERAATRRMALVSRLEREPLFANVSPEWVHQSSAMGWLHPRDPKTFPEQEAYIDRGFAWWDARVPTFGEYGFVDYWAGPHIAYVGDYPYLRRWRFTYTLRTDCWYLYARSGLRAIRRFAEKTNTTFMDGYMCHWDAPNKVKGFYVGAGGVQGCLPYIWGNRGAESVSSSTDMNQYLFYYYLTGYRRARDIVVGYGEGIKQWWTPSNVKRTGRIIKVFMAMTQAYGLTWDPELGALARLTGDILRDPEAALGLSIERPKFSAYKTQADCEGLLEGYRIFGTPELRDVARKVTTFWWRKSMAGSGHGYASPLGAAGNFLYEETGDPSIPALMALLIKRAVATDKPPRNAAVVEFAFRGIPFGQSLVTRTGAWDGQTASWVSANDFGSPVSVFLKKNSGQTVDLHFKTTQSKEMGTVGGMVRVIPVGMKSTRALDLTRMTEDSGTHETAGALAHIVIPKDAPGGVYELRPYGLGTHMALCKGRIPLVLVAAKAWRPSPPQKPPVSVWFRVPPKAKGAQIMFEKDAILHDPDGKRFGKTHTGWVDLPNKPGLWRFTLVKPGCIQVRNVPPVFAFGDRAFYFDPGVKWSKEEVKKVEVLPDDTPYIAGAVRTRGNRALYLAGKRRFLLDGGGAHPSGDGKRFLPFREGTIEFFWRPNTDTFDLARGRFTYPGLVMMRTTNGRYPWRLSYAMAKPPNSRVYFSMLPINVTRNGRTRLIGTRARRQGLVEKGKWVHVAWCWGVESGTIKGKGFTTRIFIDGRLGKHYATATPNARPGLEPLKMYLGYDLKGGFDELRISDVKRYKGDFTPPSRDGEMQPDKHTRALFHFNGNLSGVTGDKARVSGKIVER